MAVTANIHEAKTTLSKLIERAMAGEEVIIAKAGKPMVRLAPVAQPVAVDRAAIFGSMRGKMNLKDGWEDSPFDAEMERKWYGQAEARSHAAEDRVPFKPR
ncbi:type II toxin-antitoxin system Phd/YefM family antitoxin [Brevundimonas sp. R86498]|uniref:type II toxin-antitoxin system Phd/YefM family antitoxin n=1 Tax=Brevundimonas sp. R86498 TaxID=3093845 RepID=UPI0037C93209